MGVGSASTASTTLTTPARHHRPSFPSPGFVASKSLTSTPTRTKRGITPSLAKSLDGAQEDLCSGIKKHEEVIHNFSIMLHELQHEILESIVGKR